MTAVPSLELQDAIFAALEKIVLGGGRAPRGCRGIVGLGTLGGGDVITVRGRRTALRAHHTAALAKAGRIRIEVFGRNWRVITLLTGPHAGKSTQPYAGTARPHIVVDASGFRQVRVSAG